MEHTVFRRLRITGVMLCDGPELLQIIKLPMKERHTCGKLKKKYCSRPSLTKTM